MSIEVLRWIASYGEKTGEMPSLREIAQGLHKHIGPVFKVVNELDELGYIRRSKKGRNMRRILGLTPEGEKLLREEEAIYG